jgi:hypothetical protein
MPQGSNITKPGDYRLQKLMLTSLVNNKSVDIRKIFKHIEIFEDMFSPNLTAKIYIEDGVNLPEILPITGQETIELVFKTDIAQINETTLIFRVYKLEDLEIYESGKTQSYVLHLISEGGYYNFSQRCGYAVSGSVSGMVSNIFTRHFSETVWGKKLQIENTKDNYSFVLPATYSPFKAISWLATKAYSLTVTDYMPFFFYETLDGHCFKSLAHIIEEGSRDILRYHFTTRNPNPTRENIRSTTILPPEYHRIQDVHEAKRFDMAENIMEGTVSSSLLIHDVLRKQLRQNDFLEEMIFDDKKKLGKGRHFRFADLPAENMLKKGASLHYSAVTPYTVYSKANPIIDNMQIETTLLKRNYHMNTMTTQKIIIEIFGDNRKRVGQVIAVFVPKISADGHSDVAQGNRADENLSGDFIITSIKHTLSTLYSCKLELSRNCMGVI